MIHEFAISFSDPTDAPIDEAGEYVDHARADFLTDFADLELAPESIRIARGSAGYGADATIALAIITGLGSLFFAGKKVEENFDAWVRLGRRFRKAVTKLQARRGGVSVSEPVAISLAYAAVAEALPDGTALDLVTSAKFAVRNPSLLPGLKEQFAQQPDCFYLVALRSSDGDAFIVGLRSDCTTEFFHRVPTGNWMEYFQIE